MTREEAIKILQRTKHSYDTMPKALRKIMAKYPPSAKECSQAIDMAIESLSADEVRVVAEWQGKIVRCKDCRHRIDRRSDLGHFMCEMYYGQGDVSDENFCQWGERREE